MAPCRLVCWPRFAAWLSHGSACARRMRTTRNRARLRRAASLAEPSPGWSTRCSATWSSAWPWARFRWAGPRCCKPRWWAAPRLWWACLWACSSAACSWCPSARPAGTSAGEAAGSCRKCSKPVAFGSWLWLPRQSPWACWRCGSSTTATWSAPGRPYWAACRRWPPASWRPWRGGGHARLHNPAVP